MSRRTKKIVKEESEEEDIDPSSLIDTQENKPKIEQEQEDLAENNKKNNYVRLEYKQVSKLTDDERDYLINLYKNGGEHDYYKVYFYKNGTNKIVKKKQPPKYNTSRRMLEKAQAQEIEEKLNIQKQALSTEQILMEHVIDLETKFATLYQKHKKLKKNYKALRQDIYASDGEETEITPEEAKEIEQKQQKQEEEKAKKQEEKQQEELPAPEPQYEQPQQNNYYEPQQMDTMNYIERLKRPQRGYRSLMAARN